MTTGNIFEQASIPVANKNDFFDWKNDSKDTGVLSSESESQERKKKELIRSLIGIIQQIRDEKEKPRLDLENQEMIIHGTFIENLESILRNGFDDSLSKRQYGGYGKGYASNPDEMRSRRSWEEPFGRGLYFSRINGESAYNLNYESEALPNAFDILKKGTEVREKYKRIRAEEQKIRQKYHIPEDVQLSEDSVYFQIIKKRLKPEKYETVKGILLRYQNHRADPYGQKIQKAIQSYYVYTGEEQEVKTTITSWGKTTTYGERKKKEIVVDRELTIEDFIDGEGNFKVQKFKDSTGKDVDIFFDEADGWLKLHSEDSPQRPFGWNQMFVKNYPIHLLMDPAFFSEYSKYASSIRYKKGQTLPPASVKGIIVSLNTGEGDSLPDRNPFDLLSRHKPLTRRQYIPERNKETKEPKEIKREVLIRFLIKLVKKIKKENPEFEMPIYDEDGRLLFSI